MVYLQKISYNDLYSFSVTAGPVVAPPLSILGVTTMCVIGPSGVAPCQCITFGGQTTDSPCLITCFGLPFSWYQAVPETTTMICPPAWECHMVRTPGGKLTLATPQFISGTTGILLTEALPPVKNPPTAVDFVESRLVCALALPKRKTTESVPINSTPQSLFIKFLVFITYNLIKSYSGRGT